MFRLATVAPTDSKENHAEKCSNYAYLYQVWFRKPHGTDTTDLRHQVFAPTRDRDAKNREHTASLSLVKGVEVLALDATTDQWVSAAVASSMALAQRATPSKNGHLELVRAHAEGQRLRIAGSSA